MGARLCSSAIQREAEQPPPPPRQQPHRQQPQRALEQPKELEATTQQRDMSDTAIDAKEKEEQRPPRAAELEATTPKERKGTPLPQPLRRQEQEPEPTQPLPRPLSSVFTSPASSTQLPFGMASVPPTPLHTHLTPRSTSRDVAGAQQQLQQPTAAEQEQEQEGAKHKPAARIPLTFEQVHLPARLAPPPPAATAALPPSPAPSPSVTAAGSTASTVTGPGQPPDFSRVPLSYIAAVDSATREDEYEPLSEFLPLPPTTTVGPSGEAAATAKTEAEAEAEAEAEELLVTEPTDMDAVALPVGMLPLHLGAEEKAEEEKARKEREQAVERSYDAEATAESAMESTSEQPSMMEAKTRPSDERKRKPLEQAEQLEASDSEPLSFSSIQRRLEDAWSTHAAPKLAAASGRLGAQLKAASSQATQQVKETWGQGN